MKPTSHLPKLLPQLEFYQIQETWNSENIFFLDSSAFNLILSKSLHLENALYPNRQVKPRLQVESKYSISLVKLIDESSIIKGNWKVIF